MSNDSAGAEAMQERVQLQVGAYPQFMSLCHCLGKMMMMMMMMNNNNKIWCYPHFHEIPNICSPNGTHPQAMRFDNTFIRVDGSS